MEFLSQGLVEKSQAIMPSKEFQNFYSLEVTVKIIHTDVDDPFNSKFALKNRIEKQLGGIWGAGNSKYISHNILEELHFVKTHVANCNGVMLFLEKFENEDGTYCYKELKHSPKIELVKIDHVSKNGEDWIETETWAAKIFENVQKKNIEDSVLKYGINTL